jgi:hypothetical protein
MSRRASPHGGFLFQAVTFTNAARPSRSGCQRHCYRTPTPDDLFDIVVGRNLHFDQTRQRGVGFHMISALGELGRTALTAVGNSHKDAKVTYNRALAVLDEETRDG